MVCAAVSCVEPNKSAKIAMIEKYFMVLFRYLFSLVKHNPTK